MPPERLIRVRARTVLAVLGLVIAVVIGLQLVAAARQVITWILIALFFALALNPLVEWLQRQGVRRRGLAVGTAYLLVIGAATALGSSIVPSVVTEVNEFAAALPNYVRDLTAGRGRLGFLETDYQIVERVREAVSEGGVGRILGVSGTAVALTKGVLTVVVAVITIAVLTFFMLLEGPAWLDRMFALLPASSEARWRNVAAQVYRTIGGFVTGALTIAVVAGVVTAVLLTVLGVEYAFALGLVVALLDLIPLAGATLAAVLVTAIAFLDGTGVGIGVLVFFVLYQQIENHVLYPLVYSRTIQLSPLAILVAVLVGASLAGVLGALAAIPAAGTIQVLLVDILEHRRGRIVDGAVGEGTPL